MSIITRATVLAGNLSAEAKPLPQPVTDGLDTIRNWVQIIGGSIAVIGLMMLFIGLFFAHKHGHGQEFMGKAGWWLVGAMGFGLAAVIAPVFLYM
ncbi:TrbC/VirB2 family protein [Arthrobacter sp.]|uniref:TrbC/VirB2 family protein n=1 Tax=Arthrobacter sp. TaxID=1667 RepID=UPI0026DFEC0C|nr:TrbC/VirB2 family protein [Arthrobacter sp.]MDO5752453.1 TrbC/VirB2 family protein [Arthrobacter sp.]